MTARGNSPAQAIKSGTDLQGNGDQVIQPLVLEFRVLISATQRDLLRGCAVKRFGASTHQMKCSWRQGAYRQGFTSFKPFTTLAITEM